jgi:hypothetical protein
VNDPRTGSAVNDPRTSSGIRRGSLSGRAVSNRQRVPLNQQLQHHSGNHRLRHVVVVLV